MLRKVLNINKLKNYGWKLNISLEDGLKAICEDCIQNIEDK
jgi:nucleoside-diphosphate-sugar epimerase